MGYKELINPNNKVVFNTEINPFAFQSLFDLPKSRRGLLRNSFNYQNPYRGDEMTGSFQNVGNAVTSRFGGGTVANPTYPNASILNQNAKVQKNNFSALGSNRPNTYINPNNRLATPIASNGSNRPNTYINPNERIPNKIPNNLVPSDRQPGIPTANNRTTKPNMMNSLLNYASSPSGRGMARGILEASGYSTMPKSLGEVIAKGMEYSQQNVNTDLANKLAQRELDIKEQEAKAVAGSTSKDTASIKNFKFYESLNKEEKSVWDKLENQSPELAYLMALEKQRGNQGITSKDVGTLTPAEIKFDETATGILADFVLKEYPQQVSNVQKIDDVIEIMENQEVTGAVEGGTPYALKVILNPESIGVSDDIRSIIFQSLRATLGAQFTEREGENLVRATFNQYLSEEINIKRLKRLREETVKGLDTKLSMYDHLKENGTLANWNGDELLNPKEYKNNKNNIQQSLFAIEDYEGLDGDKLLEIFKSDISKEEKEFIENNIDLLNETYNLGLE